MSKIEKIKLDYLAARKSNNTVVKNLLSTFIGEYDNQSKDGKGVNSDELVHIIAKKMIKSAELVGTETAQEEINILNTYLPQMASREEVLEFLKNQDMSLGGRLIGLAKQHFNGNVDPNLVKELIS